MDPSAPSPNPVSSRNCPLRFLARVTLQLETPLHIGSGRETGGSDAGVVLDPNGLPTMPGSSLAGILRHGLLDALRESSTAPELVDRLFGFQGRARNASDSPPGQGSRLCVSFGCIHDATDAPVEGHLPESSMEQDEVLALARRPALRDHARHGRSGTVEAGGKFDALAVQVGHRFTFELELAGQEDDRAVWEKLLSLLRDPRTRIGGRGRRGLGRFSVVRIAQPDQPYDLRQQAGFERYADYNPALSGPAPANWKTTFAPAPTEVPGAIAVTLQPRHFWMFGGGRDEDADAAPVFDSRVVWNGENEGHVEKDLFYVPGSGLKGALRHRAWFHACLSAGYFDGMPEAGPEFAKARDVVRGLFGHEPGDPEGKFCRGALFLDDVFLRRAGESDASRPVQNHVSLDRFTGGAREGLLFNERPLSGGGFTFHLLPERALTPDETTVLDAVLADLLGGRLAIGAGAGRGLGFCDGERRPAARSQAALLSSTSPGP